MWNKIPFLLVFYFKTSYYEQNTTYKNEQNNQFLYKPFALSFKLSGLDSVTRRAWSCSLKKEVIIWNRNKVCMQQKYWSGIRTCTLKIRYYSKYSN